MPVTPFGTAPDGSAVLRVALSQGGTQAALLTWGASLQDLRLDGMAHGVVLGSPRLEDYLGPMRYFGAIVGRVANRIAQGRAVLDGRDLALDRNEAGRTTLHGGSAGSGVRNWQLAHATDAQCVLTLTLSDGEGGFPGTLNLTATYTLEPDGALRLGLTGETDAPTFCNPAHHAFWSLTGGGLSGHLMQIAAPHYLPVDAHKIPLGAPHPVDGTAFDFRQPRPLLAPGQGEIDHNFCLSEADAPLRPVCWLTAPGHGLALRIDTTAPGLQVYDASRMNTAPAAGLAGVPYGPHSGVALEPQRWPDAPNQPGYPPILLRPGETFCQDNRFHLHATSPGN